MTGIGHCVLLGTLAEPLQEQQTRSGKPWARALLEIRTYRRPIEDGPAQEEVTLVPVNVFSRQAEIALQYLKLGDAVGFEIRICGSEFKSGNGEVKRGVTLICDRLLLIPNGRRRGEGP